ncbi:Phosphoribosyl transferase domain protein [compost metagenome]
MQRFANIRDHLYVANPKVLTARSNVLVLDDVVTSGSTLIYAKKYIEQVVNCDVKCLAVAKNIGKIIG